MAELTKQQSIKLLTMNKFRISAASTSRSRNLTHRSIDNPETKQKSIDRYKVQSTPKYPQTESFKKALLKIGALQKDDLKFSFIPDQEDHKTFRTKRLNSLRMKYFQDRDQLKSDPYNDENIDQAALGCWKYGECNTEKSIWRRYRQNLNKLNYETHKLVSKKSVH